jgi:lipopolysaccharide biosynthesis regulator YciM
VRVHQHLLSRGDLAAADLHRAQHALALDYLKAGLLDRAEEALLKLEGTEFEVQARLALLANYERSRDWQNAAEIARRLQASGQGSFNSRLSHYLCEQAEAHIAKGAQDDARRLLEQAIVTAPQAARPRMELAQLLSDYNDHQGAYQTLLAAVHAAPAAVPLIAPLLAQSAIASGHIAKATSDMEDLYRQSNSLDVLDAVVALEAAGGFTASNTARERYAHHLEKEPSLVAAAKWIAGEKLEHEQFHPQVQRALDNAVKPLTRYRCAACGFEAKRHFWQCPGCQTWDSYPARRVEEL